MKVVLAVVGSQGLGEPFYAKDLFNFSGYSMYPTYSNLQQFNYAIKRLNKAVLTITKRCVELDPDFDPRRDIEVITGDALGADSIAQTAI